MRLKIVAMVIAIVISLSVLTVAVQAFSFPQPVPPAAGDFAGRQRGYHDSPGPYFRQTDDHTFYGLTGVDYLGKARDLPDTGRFSSVFPGTWLAGRASGERDDRATYLGFAYVRSGAPAIAGDVLFTGERSGGRRVYVSADDYSPPGMPGRIFLRDGDRYTAYTLADPPPVYAYVACGAFNVNESVRFGMVNNGGDTLELMNAAPFEIQRKEGGTWRTVFTPVAAQVITPVRNGTAKEWQWDQQLDDLTAASTGDYRVLIAGEYAAAFRLAPDTPAVWRSNADFDRPAVTSLAVDSPVPAAFGKAYPSPSAEGREDVASIMQFKAKALGLDPASLRKAIEAAGGGGLPCLAVHARYEGRPAWVIVYSPGAGTSVVPEPYVYVTGDAPGNAVDRP
ncbi:MAG: hypothetical protein A4E28_00977 [Methanocella sp. PtaU1.Bin125]|nr:MAG: hypothetical protein A4E28_00977 [Methanocella sp. PtaU1.Bin125]